jgi:hypothetical protein
VTAPTAQLTSRAATVGGTLLVVAGALLAGVVGGIVAGAALYIAWLLSPRWAAAAALLGLVVAAAATAVEWPADAADAGRLAGIGALVAVATAAAIERAPFAEPVPRPTEQALRRAGRWVAVATVAAPGLALATGLWLAGPGAPLSARDQAVVASLQSGEGIDVDVAPLAPIVAAFLPGSPERAVLVAWLVTVLAAATVGRAFRGFGAAVIAGGDAAALAAVATPRLAEALAGLGIIGAAALIRPDARTLGRTTAAGVALGAATLARPDAALVVLVALAWLVATADLRHVAALAGGSAAVVTPWLVWHARAFDTWWAFDPATGEVPGVWLAPVAAVAAAVALVAAAARIRDGRNGRGNDRHR